MVLGLIGLMAVLGQAGCSGEPVDLSAVRDQTADTKARIDALREQEAKALAAATASGDTTGADKARENLAAIDKAANVANQTTAIVDKLVNPDGTINADAGLQAAGAAAMAVNPFLGLAVALGGPLLVGLVQQVRVRRQAQAAADNLNAAKEIVKSIEAAKAVSPSFKESFKGLAKVIDHEQGPRAARIVKDVQRVA